MSDQEHTECKKLLGLLSDYIDGEVSSELCQEIERHVAECQNCRVVVDTLRKTISLYQTSSDPAVMPAEVRERLYRTLNLEDYLKH
jgi:predicted anti-sigma-YlaC factor YlaD